MARLTARYGTKGYESMNRAFSSNRTVSIAPRSLFSNSAEMPDMSAVGSFEEIDANSNYTRHQSTVSEHLWNAIRNGARIGDLIKNAPEDVILFLRTHAVKKLGSFKMKDTDVLLAFDDQIMLTWGLDTARNPEYQRNWHEVVRLSVEKSSKRRRKFLEDNPWEESVTVTAYVVNIEDAAAGFENGLLSPLVKKSQIGVASNEIFDLPVVRAVIEYKWRNWARRYLIIEFGLYLGWLFSFVVFLIIYIETDLREGFDEQSSKDKFLEVVAYMMDVLSLVFMLPFLVIEYNTICSYGLRWLQLWNVIDSIAYVLQFAISYCHFIAPDHMENKYYDTLLAAQCVLLFIKVQYFGRVFGARTSFMELLARVISRARWFFVFIILTMVSVALSFSVLYKDDADGGEETADDFSNVIRSVVTTYAILLGNFETDYVFDGTNRPVKGVFFLFFQVIMSITVLNLLIAVMTESYGTVTTESRIMYNIGRAQIMDELEVALPKSWGPRLKPFCHFLMVEPASKQDSSKEQVNSVPSVSEEGGLRDEVKSLKEKIDTLTSKFDSMAERFPPAASNAF